MANNQFTFKSVTDRFLSHVEMVPWSGCWIWMGSTNGNRQHPEYNYGKFGQLTDGIMQTVYAHRASYEMFRGKIQPGLQLDHVCRVRLCVNPMHLEPVIRLENVARGASGDFQASKTHCPQGHPYDTTNTLLISRLDGKSVSRMCRECSRERRRQWYKTSKR